MNPSVALRQITKDFGPVRALDAVDFTAHSGRIHALVGENGAGKTTLMRVLYGALQATSGEVLLDDKEVELPSSATAIAHGIGMVSQHYSIIPALTTLDNLMLGAEPSFMLDRRAAEIRATEMATRMGFTFRWDERAEQMSPASAQKLEILKLLWREARIMILDEPTAMLSPLDADALYSSLRGLADGGATIIVVTHRLPEVFDFCDEVTVLRGGKLVKAAPVSDVSPSELAELIVGRPVSVPDLPSPRPGQPILQVSGLSVQGDRGDAALKDISFELCEGEVVGVAGVDGNGQKELFEALMGLRKIQGGKVLLGDKNITHDRPDQRLQLGLRLIPEDRHHEGVIEDWSLVDNAGLGLQNQTPIAERGRLNRVALRETATLVAAKFHTKHGGLDQPMASLSGGNQQRFVAARALHGSPRIALAFQPARGLDLAGIADVYTALREVAKADGAVLVVSYDLDELLAYCDRVIVLCHGELTQPDVESARDRAVIGRLMVGVAD